MHEIMEMSSMFISSFREIIVFVFLGLWMVKVMEWR